MIGILWSHYLAAISRFPISTKLVTASILAGLGDCIAQLTSPPLASATSATPSGAPRAQQAAPETKAARIIGEWWSPGRTLRFVTWSLLTTPPLHVWYNYLAITFPTSALRRMLADQLLWCPPSIFLFLSFLALTEHGFNRNGVAAAAASLKMNYVSIVLTNWAVWPCILYANFRITPVHLQVPLINACALGWTIFLSMRSARQSRTPPKELPAVQLSPSAAYPMAKVRH